MAGAPPPPPPPSAPPPPPGQGPEDREDARFNTRMLAILGSVIVAAIVLWALFGRNLTAATEPRATATPAPTGTPIVTVVQLTAAPAATQPPPPTQPARV